MKKVNCLICNTPTTMRKARVNSFVAKRMYLDHPPKVILATCFSCGFQFYLPRPNDIELARLYKDYRGIEYQKERQKYDQWYTKELNDNLENHPTLISARKNNINRLLNGFEFDSILDYGGDRGQFMPDAKYRYVYDVSGTKLIVGIKKWEGKPKKFDLVICSHLMEHISDPLALYKKLKSFDGIIYIEVPAKGPNITDGIPIMHEHINFFTPKSLEIMTGGLFEVRKQDFGFCKYKVVCGLAL